MDALLLQDWATFSLVGGGASSKITQGAPGYLDVSEYHDLVFYLHVATSVAAGGIPVIQYQTAPTAEDSGFLTLFQTPSTFAGGTRVDVILGSYSPVPPSKYVRWMCGGRGFTRAFPVCGGGYPFPAGGPLPPGLLEPGRTVSSWSARVT